MLQSKPQVTKPERSLSKEIKKAASILKDGGIVIFPTDTVYGIGCRFDRLESIKRLYQTKKTPKDQNFPILVSNINQVKKLAKVTEVAEKLISKYWPGALTIVLESLNGSTKLGFRMPDSNLVKSLIAEVGVPTIGTSANFNGQTSPKTYEELDPEFMKLADFVIKGECQKKIESTVVDATFDPPKVIRQGAVELE